jgi:hypothetical protein
MKERLRRMLPLTAMVGAPLLFSLLLGRSMGKPTPKEEEVEVVAAADLKGRRPPGTRSPALPAGGVDLLDLVQVAEDAVAGTWGFQDRALITSSTEWGRLQISCTTPDEYDLRLVLVRKRGDGAFHLGFLMGDRQGIVTLDGHDGKTTWLMLEDRLDAVENGTTWHGALFPRDRAVELILQVRKSSLALIVDRAPIFAWKGRPEDLAILSVLRALNSKALVFGSSGTVFRIQDAVVLPPAPVVPATKP